MAGGKITRIVKGTNSIECETWTVYTDKFTAYAGKGSHFTADGGTIIGEPKEAPIISNHFVDGYWSSDSAGNNKITKAELGDTVYFIVELKNLVEDQKSLSFQLHEYNAAYWISLWIIPYQYVPKNSKKIGLINITGEGTELEKESDYKNEEITGTKSVIKFTLTEKGILTNMLREDREKYLQLYFDLEYNSEQIKLPKEENLYLKIFPKNGEIIFQSASQNHKLPMMFDARTGDPYYVEAKQQIVKSGLNANKIKGLLIPPEIDMFTKKSYEFAVRRLKAGELVFSDGTVGKTKRLYEYTIKNIDETFSEKVVMGINKGNFNPGVTSKSVNQLEAFSSKGIAGGAKFIGKVMPLFSSVMDISNMAVAVGNGEKPPIPFMPPFVTMEVERICNEQNEFVYETFFNGLNNVLLGNIDYHKKGMYAVEAYIEQWNNAQRNVSEWQYNWQVVRLSQPTLEKLLKGEIKGIEYIVDLTKESGYEEAINCGILVFTNYETDEKNREVVKHYIYTIFLPEMIE